MKQCRKCGVTDESVKTYGEPSHTYCQSCADKLLARCVHCKRKRKTFRTNTEGGSVCISCYNALNYHECEVCKGHHTIFANGSNLRQFASQFPNHVWPDSYRRVCGTCVSKFREAGPDSQQQPRCTICGSYSCQDSTPLVLDNGSSRHLVCNNCRQALQTCDCCGNLTLRGRRMSDGKIACHHCRAIRYRSCMACSTSYLRTEEDSPFCPECRSTHSICDHCHGAKRNENLTQTTSHGRLCQRCYRALIRECEFCKSTTRCILASTTGQMVCADCRHSKGIGHLESYNYRPDKFNTYGKGLLLGIEHEIPHADVSNATHTLNVIAKHFHESDVYCQHDGSVHNGVEVVAHPRTLKWIKDNPDWVKNLFPVNSKGKQLFIKHESAGMHVHVDRKAFKSRKHLLKFMAFIAMNVGLVEYIAERKSGGSRAWRFSPPEILRDKCKGIDPQDKYVDVNIKHRETIEVRIFAGAICPEQMMKNIEFVQALVHYSQGFKLKDMMNMGKFIEFVNKCDYAENLQAYLKKITDLTQFHQKKFVKPQLSKGRIRAGGLYRITSSNVENGNITSDDTGLIVRVDTIANNGVVVGELLGRNFERLYINYHISTHRLAV